MSVHGTLSFQNSRFDHYDLDRLCREGDPELQEELWGSDMEALYRKNDELIDQLGIADLRDMEAHYRLVQRHGMRITCKSCCSSLGPGCLIWDLNGDLRVIGHYWNFSRQNSNAAAHSLIALWKGWKRSRVSTWLAATQRIPLSVTNFGKCTYTSIKWYQSQYQAILAIPCRFVLRATCYLNRTHFSSIILQLDTCEDNLCVSISFLRFEPFQWFQWLE